MTTTVNKDDNAKAPLQYLGMLRAPLGEVAHVLRFGRKKYPGADDNWKRIDDAATRYLAAGLRHILARLDGEMADAETGRSHLAHAGCCVLFALWFDLRASVKTPEPYVGPV